MSSRENAVIGRYRLSVEIASGGMATVHLGRLLGPVGFTRTVAIKRLHPHLARNPDFVAGFLDEARLAARIRHPNVVPTTDVIATDGEVLLVMDYVEGETLARLLSTAMKAGCPPSPPIVSAVLVDALHGLHAAHEATSEAGQPLHIVHRDVSPQNILVGTDGLSRVLDFGIAKAANRSHETRDGVLKGKLGYMSPEQAMGQPLDRRSDVFSAGVVLWEALTASRMYPGTESGGVIFQILHDPVPELPPAIRSPELDAVLHGSLAKQPHERFPTALELATALERAIPPATPREVAAWLRRVASDSLSRRAHALAGLECEGIRDEGSESGADAEPTRVLPSIEARTPSGGSTAQAASAAMTPGVGGPATPRWRGRSVVLAAALGGLLALAIGEGAQALGARRAAPSAQLGSTAEPPSALPAAPPAPSGATSREGTTAPVATTTTASSIAPATTTTGAETAPATAATASAPKPSATQRAARKAPISTRSPAAASGCEDPMYFDEQGIKRVKRGCVR